MTIATVVAATWPVGFAATVARQIQVHLLMAGGFFWVTPAADHIEFLDSSINGVDITSKIVLLEDLTACTGLHTNRSNMQPMSDAVRNFHIRNER